MKTVFDSIYAFAADSDFMDSISDNLFFDEADQNVDAPYCVYFSPPGTTEPMNTFNAVIDKVYIQFNIYTNDKRVAFDILDECKTHYRKEILSATGYKDFTLKKDEEVLPFRDGEEWQATLVFTTILQED